MADVQFRKFVQELGKALQGKQTVLSCKKMKGELEYHQNILNLINYLKKKGTTDGSLVNEASNIIEGFCDQQISSDAFQTNEIVCHFLKALLYSERSMHMEACTSFKDCFTKFLNIFQSDQTIWTMPILKLLALHLRLFSEKVC